MQGSVKFAIHKKPSSLRGIKPNKDFSVPLDPTCPESRGSSLGLQWDMETDRLSIKTELKNRPMTRRGLLGYVMSPYDPLGIAAPVMLLCKLLQREVFPPLNDDPHNYAALGWDGILPSYLKKQWEQMVSTCYQVQDLEIPRSYYPLGNGTPISQQLHAFADASLP